MADLLLSWLNDELQLSAVVSDLDVDFASGYLIGEVLHRLNQQHNFADFVRSSTADAKIINFCLLEPSLRNLNIKFNATSAAAIMNEHRGAAAQLLYQIKVAAARIQRAPAVSTIPFEETKIIPLHNRPVKLPKPMFDSGNHRLFEHSIRRHVQSVAALQQQKDEAAEEITKHKAYLAARQKERELLEITKAERLHRAFIHSQFIKEALEETDSPAWRMALQTKDARERRRATFYRELMAKHQKTQEDLTFSLRRTVKDDIDAFERLDAGNTKTSAKIPQRKSSGYGLRSLTTSLGKNNANVNDFMPTARSEGSIAEEDKMRQDTETIKHQKQQREKRREALERRRKRFLQTCSLSHSNFMNVRATATMEMLSLRSTNMEKDVQEEIARISQYKDIARENRELRTLAYQQQREENMLSKVDRDANHYQLLLQQFDDEIQMQRTELQQLEGATSGTKHYDVELIARSVLSELIQLTLCVAGVRESTLVTRQESVFLDDELWAELRVLFVDGRSLTSGLDIDRQLLDAREFDRYTASFRQDRFVADYVGSTAKGSNVSPWHPRDLKFVGAAEVLEECYILGEEVKYLRWIASTVPLPERPPPSQGDPSGSVIEEHTLVSSNETPSEIGIEPTTEPTTDTFPNELRILIFGPPFAGKATQARLLAAKYDLALFSVEQLLKDAMSEGGTLGIQIKQLLSDGHEVTADLYAQLVIEAIHKLNRERVGETALTTENSKKSSGWVVYDLPGTETQGRKLEELLSGYVDPSSIPSPYDLESPIAPGCAKPGLPSTFFHGKSGVDLVFYLHCAEDFLMERCLGLLEDVETKEKWHLQYSPPPNDVTFRHRLQHANGSLHATGLLSVYLLSGSSCENEQRAWFSKFGILHDVDNEITSRTPDEVHQALTHHVDEFITEQGHKNIAREQEKEDGELLSMIGEAGRQEHILSLEATIAFAQEELTQRQQVLQAAEDAKAKKEELVELRAAVESGRQKLEQSVLDAKAWAAEEQAQLKSALNAFSGQLTPQLVRVLTAMWNDMETQYISSMHECFFRMRCLRSNSTSHLQILVEEFCMFVRRPDRKQAVLNQFQHLFNEVLDEMRYDESTKIELHARTDILQDELRSIIDAKTTEDEAELEGLATDGWSEDTCRSIALTYQTALQAECDRFRVSLQVLIEGYCAASSNRAGLSTVVEALQAQFGHFDLTCRVFFDPAQVEEVPAQSAAPVAPSPAKGTAAKGKGKQATAPASAAANASTTTPAANDPAKEGNGDPTSVEDMGMMYDSVLHKSEAFVVGVMIAATTPKDPSISSQSSGDHSDESDVCLLNLRKGIKYEHEQMQRRVHFLHSASLAACEHITSAVHSMETCLRQVIVERKQSEEATIAAIIQHIRSTIESESDLPCFIDVASPSVYRFPPTAQLLEDTVATIDLQRRLVPIAPPIDPPVVEENHDLLINPRQQQALKAALGWEGRRLLPTCQVVELMNALASLPDALPPAWRSCSEVAFAELASKCMRRRHGFVDVDALVDKLSSDEGELRRVMFEDQRRAEEAAAASREAEIAVEADSEPARAE